MKTTKKKKKTRTTRSQQHCIGTQQGLDLRRRLQRLQRCATWKALHCAVEELSLFCSLGIRKFLPACLLSRHLQPQSKVKVQARRSAVRVRPPHRLDLRSQRRAFALLPAFQPLVVIAISIALDVVVPYCCSLALEATITSKANVRLLAV